MDLNKKALVYIKTRTFPIQNFFKYREGWLQLTKRIQYLSSFNLSSNRKTFLTKKLKINFQKVSAT